MRREYTKEEVKALKNIARKIKEYKLNGKNMGRLEYYLLGGMPLKDILSAIYWLKENGKLSIEEFNILKVFTGIQLGFNAVHGKDKVLSIKYIYGNREITEIEKNSIWNSLLKKGIAEENIDDIVFSTAVLKYAQSKGLVKVKKRVLNNNK